MTAYDDSRWWEKTGVEKTAESITIAIKMLDKFRDQRKRYLSTCARLYGNLPPVTFFGGPMEGTADTGLAFGSGNQRLTRNIIQSCIDTIEARVASRIHPMIMWLSSNGSYKARRRAKKLTRFSEGIFRDQNTKTLMPRVFKDAEIFGSGYVAISLEHGRIKYARFLEHELHWDEVEARYNEPRQLHRVRSIDRQVLSELYPSKKGLINKTENEVAIAGGDNARSVAELIQVRESWRLPDSPEKPGRHIISVDAGCLLDEEWCHDFFPIVKIDYNERPIGWTGQGVVEILCDTQVALNRHLHALSTSLYLAGTFKIALLEGSRVDPQEINNGFGSVFWYRNPPGGGDGMPRYVMPQAYPAEGYAEIARLEQKGYQLAGISTTSAAGIKQPGVNAAVAMREMVDIENDRFATISASYEQAHVMLSKITITLIADEIKSGRVTEYKVNDLGSRIHPILDLKDIEFDQDLFTVQPFPVSALPHDPEGRLQMVQEWTTAGWITPRQSRRLMDFPDVQSWESMQDAATEWIECTLDKIIDDGEYSPPDAKEDDLQGALELVTQEINLAKLGDLESDRLRDLRTYRDEVQRLILEAQPPPPPNPQQSPAQLGKPPQAPVSELMPMTA